MVPLDMEAAANYAHSVPSTSSGGGGGCEVGVWVWGFMGAVEVIIFCTFIETRWSQIP